MAHQVSSNKWVSALLASCTRTSDASWVAKNIINLSWEEATAKFRDHYRDPLFIHRLRQDFYTLRKSPGERMIDFASRFETLAHRLKLDDDDSLAIIPHFIACLPNPLASQLQLHSVSRPGALLSEFIRLAISLESAISSPSPNVSQHQSASTNLRSSPVGVVPAPQPPSYSRSPCAYHGTRGHSSEDCHVLKGRIAKASTGDNQSPSIGQSQNANPVVHPPSGAATKAQPSSNFTYSNTPRDPCRYCNQRGHWSQQCPQRNVSSSGQQSNTTSTVRLNLAAVHPLTRLAVDRFGPGRDFITASTCSSSAHDETLMASTMATEKVLSAREHSSDTFKLPLLVDGHELTAVIDTGASHSIIDEEFARKAGILFKSHIQTVSLASRDATTSTTGKTDNLPCSSGHFRVESSFFIMPLEGSTQCLLGRDLLPFLGVSVCTAAAANASTTPISTLSPQETQEDLDDILPDLCSEDSEDEDEEVPHNLLATSIPSSIPSSLSQGDNLKNKIRGLIEDNLALSPSHRYSHPDAIITLDTGDAAPIFRRPYRVPQRAEEQVSRIIQEWLRDGVIATAPAGCRWNSPLVVVPKSGGDIRVCMDPRHINAILRNGDNFPIPIITDIIDRFSGANVFSSLDLKAGFNQFSIAEEDQHKLAFTWDGVQYMFVGAPFGLAHLSSSFQRVLSTIFSHLSFVIVYIDNLYVISRTIMDHRRHIIQVLVILNAHNLRLNHDKCLYFLQEIEVLGYVVSTSGVSIDRSKLVGMEEIPIPTTSKELQSFLGFANFFRRFVPGFASISAPLDILRKTPSFTLDNTQECAFNTLKTVLHAAPLLAFPDFSRPCGLATDASSTGIGAVLLQPPTDHGNQWPEPLDANCKVVAFFSRALTSSERNYATNKRELLAVVFGLEKCRYYLWGRKFTLFTDHRSLTFLFSQRDISALLARWYDEIMEFSFDIQHIPGVSNILPDALSRLYPVPLRPTLPEVSPDINAGALQLAPEEHELLQLPSDVEHQKILAEAHALGHLGAKSLVGRVHELGFHWPALSADAQRYVSQCITCQRHLISRKGFHPLRPVTANFPMAHVAMDLAGPLPETPGGNIYLLILLCIFTRFLFLRALPNKEALTIAIALFTIFCEVGFPDIFQSDNGGEFVSDILRELVDLVNAEHRLLTPYNPRGNGGAERYVGLSVTAIKKMVAGALNLWDLAVPGVQFSLNTRITDLHGSAAFSLFFARSFPGFRRAILPSTVDLSSSSIAGSQDDHEDWMHVISQMVSLVVPAILELRDKTNEKRCIVFNKKHRIISFPIGSYVMATDPVRENKLSPLHEGPYKVVRRNRGGAYILMDHDNVLLRRNYAPSQLIAVPKPSQPIDNEQVHTVERIVDHRKTRGKLQYLVKWRDFSETYNSWEPESSFFDPLPITIYWRSKPMPN